MRKRVCFASHLHKYLLIVIKLNRNTQCTSGVRQEFHLRYKRKVKLRVWGCVACGFAGFFFFFLHRVFGCLVPCLRWGGASPVASCGGTSRGALRSPGSLDDKSQEKPRTKTQNKTKNKSNKNPPKTTKQNKTTFSSHQTSTGAWRPPRHSLGKGKAVPRSGLLHLTLRGEGPECP